MTNGLLQRAFVGKKVWLSGHTGFKGSWLSEWLLSLGAEVYGFALEPPTTPSLFDQLGLAERLRHERGDLRDAEAVKKSIFSVQPDFVFHLAAQAIVRTAFVAPVETYTTNVLGTVHVMEALRGMEKPCAAVLITTDKCYENRECVQSYREDDPLGGYDPYSSSKAAAEIAIHSWRKSFFAEHPVSIASARAGNVIGGGDWAKDRIVPDCIRALQREQAIGVRNKTSTRPWQHVLEPLSGYLWLAAVLADSSLRPFDRSIFRSAFNLGPALDANRTVLELVIEVLKYWPGRWEDKSDPNAVHEAKLLNLATDRAFHFLGWKPVWTFEQAIAQTVEWYRSVNGSDKTDEQAAVRLTRAQIAKYTNDAAKISVPWATEVRAATAEK
jgi:CDP-glucose 4,6-dehydratase